MSTWVGVVALLMWSGTAVLSTITVAVPAYLLLTICFSVCGGLMLLSRAKAGKKLLVRPRLTTAKWIAGVIGIFGSFLTYFLAMKLAPAIEVSLITYSWPLMLSVMVAKKGTRFTALVGGIIGFLGIYVLVSDRLTADISPEILLGYSLALLSALSWAGYSWFLTYRPGATEDIGWIALGCSVLALACHYLIDNGTHASWNLTAMEWLGAIMLGLGSVGGAFFLWDYGLKHGNAQLLASLSFFTPLLSSILLALFGFAEWSTNIMIAIALILLGAAVVNKKSSSAADKNSIATEDISLQH